MSQADDEEPSVAEREDAERLARALDEQSVYGSLPDDALEAAALLRATLDEGLGEERYQRILDQVLRDAPTVERRPLWLRWSLALGFSALAALLGVVVLGRDGSVDLPQPDSALLEAQAAFLRGEGERNYQEHLRGYRHVVYASLGHAVADRSRTR